MPSTIPKSEAASECAYNTRLQKGGALLDDMRLLVQAWREDPHQAQIDTAILENILGKRTRSRALDTFRRSFIPRYVNGRPPNAWKIVRALEDRDMPVEVLRPVYYWITAKNERLLYDFVCDELNRRSRHQQLTLTTADAAAWIASRLAQCGKAWSETVTIKVARGLLAALRDFGILQGTAVKRIAPVYVPIEAFAYLAFLIHQDGASAGNLLRHSDWSLFLYPPAVVERLFLEADRHGLLRYQAAGRVVRIEFPARNENEMADVVASKTN